MNRLSLPKAAALFFCLGLTAYFNAIFHPFVHDDVVFIQNNPLIQQWNLAETFFHYESPDPGNPIVNPYWRPVLDILNKIQFQLFGLNPHGYHFFNIILHILNSLLVFILIRLLTKDDAVSVVVGLLFLLHPVQTEAVACVSGISNLAFSFFCLLSFILYIRSRAENPSRYLGLASLFFLSLSLLSKEQAVVLPVLILIYEWTVNGFKRFKPSSQSVQMVFVLLVYLFLRRLITGHATTSLGPANELLLRVLHIPQTLFSFITLILWPTGLHYYRSLDILSPYRWPLIDFISLAGLVIILMKNLPREKYALAVFGICWFVVALLPTLNVLPLINEYSLILNAEHFLYLPLAGFLLFFVLVFRDVLVRLRAEDRFGPLQKDGLSIVLIILIVICIHQNFFWRSETALFERTVAFEKNFGRGHLLLAKSYYFEKRYEEAIKEYQTALGIMQGYWDKTSSAEPKKFYQGFIVEIYFDLAHCFEGLGSFDQAISMYEAAIRLEPQSPVVHNNLGSIYLNQKKFTVAEEQFRAAITFDPNDILSKNNLAICLIEQNRKEEAKNILDDILKTHPDFAPAKSNLGLLLSQGIH